MIRRIIAIAELCIRTAIRSRMIIAISGLLLAAVIIIPLSVHGDGTPEGETTILLRYTLGTSAVIQAIGTLWASCASIPVEITGGQLGLMLTKPLSPLETWIGKWIGIIAMNGAVLIVVFAFVIGLLHLRLTQMNLPESTLEGLRNSILGCRQRNLPDLPSPEKTAIIWYDTLKAQGRIPDDADKNEILSSLSKRAAENYIPISANRNHSWGFSLKSAPANRKAWIRIRYAAAGGAVTPVTLKIEILDEHNTVTAHKTIHRSSGMEATALFEPESISTSTPTIRITHIANGSDVGILISERKGVELLIPDGSFTSNLARALLITLAAMMVLSAIGLTTGAMFSLPVAILSATTLMLITLSGQFYLENRDNRDHAAETDTLPLLMTKAASAILSTAGHISSPIINAAPYSSLSRGIRIPWRSVVNAVLPLGLGSALLLAPLSAVILRRREIDRGMRR